MSRKQKVQAMAVATLEVDNPLYRVGYPEEHVPRRIKVERALRDDQLARLHHRHHIGEAMYFAGRHWQRLYAEAAIGRLTSPGDIKEPVDGSRVILDPYTPRQQNAMKQLARLDRVLGIEGCMFVRDLLAENMSYTSMARRRRISDDYAGRRMRECLDTLAKELGYCT